MGLDAAARIRDSVEAHENVLISGGTGTGKTTLLNALAAFLPPSDRIVVIEETSELQIAMPNVVRFEARRAQRQLPAVTVRDLLRATLRQRPDRVILGEVRGGESAEMWNRTGSRHNAKSPTTQIRITGLSARLLDRVREGPDRLRFLRFAALRRDQPDEHGVPVSVATRVLRSRHVVT